ncbi:hypothetical protein ACFPZ0_06995 [Streptomonospora nanhaiensis]|uniref:Putative glycosyltransferase n=1 Tax=Streptomonospora nanhaiensis TaxID=1323731 RepID=A0A853BTG5_9ACTN|nr:hypothetical protein [Streptomonospora nanhaiensis]MBX9387018.1 hypothetical protein [Streptomonospora nanhaiensis]NYI97791.1 putative glycosyltransferase [Streptomonospora nanhaiensis]
MKLTLLAKDEKSHKKACPSVYFSDSGEFIVQGQQLSSADMGELQNPLAGETAVRIAPDIVLRAVEAYQRNTAT